MDIEIKSWLYDIQNAILEIESFIKDAPNFNSYTSDVKTRRAVERNLEIIGEAMNRITKKDSEITFSNSRKVIDTRNRIIHGYDSVSDEVIWSIIISQIPILKEEIQKYI